MLLNIEPFLASLKRFTDNVNVLMEEGLSSKLGATATAADSFKLNGLTLNDIIAQVKNTPVIGDMKMWVLDALPVGFVPMDGALYNVADYPAAASYFGTLYGGDGINTFGIPDLSNRVFKGLGGALELGDIGGSDSVTLTEAQLPMHNHPLSVGTTTKNGKVASVTVTAGGSGYTAATVAFVGGGGTGATAVAVITDGVITGITVTGSGSGYTSTPSVVITGDGSGATANAVDATGVLSSPDSTHKYLGASATGPGLATIWNDGFAETVQLEGSELVGNGDAVDITNKFFAGRYIIAIDGLSPTLVV